MENKIKCPRCGNDEVWKAGEHMVKQQYECKKKFITEINYTNEFKQKAIKMLYEGNSERAVGRIMGINKSTFYNGVKKAEEKIKSSKR